MTWSIISIDETNAHYLDHICDDVFDYDVRSKWLTPYLAQPNHKLIVAVSNGLVVAQIRAIVHFQPDEPPHLYIDNLGVAPKYQRLGIAKALFSALLEWGKTRGCEGYWVATECDNDEGNSFYRAIGLKPETMYFYEG